MSRSDIDRLARLAWSGLVGVVVLFSLRGLRFEKIDLCFRFNGSILDRILYLVGIPKEFRSSSRIRLTRVDQGGFLVYPGVYVSGKQVSGSRKLNRFFKSSFGSLSSF